MSKAFCRRKRSPVKPCWLRCGGWSNAASANAPGKTAGWVSAIAGDRFPRAGDTGRVGSDGLFGEGTAPFILATVWASHYVEENSQIMSKLLLVENNEMNRDVL